MNTDVIRTAVGVVLALIGLAAVAGVLIGIGAYVALRIVMFLWI